MITETVYKNALKPVLFKFDPETVHNRFSDFGKLLGCNGMTRMAVRGMFYYSHNSLQTTVAGIKFENPVGLAAGFDKNAKLYNILPEIGFGFAELGSITGEPCKGNPRPRLFRFPKDDRTERSRDSLAARIAEILPVEGQITLSGKNRPVIIYDGETQSYRETALDVTKVQPVPTDKKFELNGNKPIGPLEIVSFEAPPLWDAPTKGLYPYNGAAANFLEKLLAIKAPVVEIGNQVGGYFPMRPYS